MNLSNMKISLKIGGGFAIIVAIIIALGLLAFSQISEIGQGEEQIATNNMPSVEMAGQLRSIVNTLRELEARHVLASADAELNAREAESARRKPRSSFVDSSL